MSEWRLCLLDLLSVGSIFISCIVFDNRIEGNKLVGCVCCYLVVSSYIDIYVREFIP